MRFLLLGDFRTNLLENHIYQTLLLPSIILSIRCEWSSECCGMCGEAATELFA